jgi:GNAT superfamily N-acetyltransferase
MSLAMSVEIHELADPEREWARDLLAEHWSSAAVVSRGKLHHADRLPGFVALADGVPSGLLTYKVTGDQCEIVTLNSLIEGRGVGTALVAAVKDAARQVNCRRLWLVTTNDDAPAIRFYTRCGFTLVVVHEDAIEVSRRLKPEIPHFGYGGVPIRDELEFEILL